MNYELLNKIVDYIESNLTEKIDFKYLAKKLGLNMFIMERVFSIITNTSIKEYIRKRRLSLAYEEIKNTDNKIIDVAVKYGYESSVSFARSFKREFNVAPSKIRKDKSSVYKMFPKIDFSYDFNYDSIVKFSIKNIKTFNVYGNLVFAKNLEDFHYKIRMLYKELKENKSYDMYNENERYAISYFKNGEYHYLLGSKKGIKESDVLKIKDGKYAIFEVGSLKQKDIIKTYDFINKIWNNSSRINIISKLKIEVYKNDNCFIYVPIKKET